MRALEMSESAQRRAIAAFNRGKSGSDRLRGYLRSLKSQPCMRLKGSCALVGGWFGLMGMRAIASVSCSFSGGIGWGGPNGMSGRWRPITSHSIVRWSAVVTTYQDALRLLGVICHQ